MQNLYQGAHTNTVAKQQRIYRYYVPLPKSFPSPVMITGLLDMLRYEHATVGEVDNTHVVVEMTHECAIARWASFGLLIEPLP